MCVSGGMGSGGCCTSDGLGSGGCFVSGWMRLVAVVRLMGWPLCAVLR